MVKPNSKEDPGIAPEGGGRTRVIENGNVLKRCQYLSRSRKLPEAMQQCSYVGEVDFFACGPSLVYIPRTDGAYSSCQLALF
jgi:coproporphyrinogen III oxidase